MVYWNWNRRGENYLSVALSAVHEKQWSLRESQKLTDFHENWLIITSPSFSIHSDHPQSSNPTNKPPSTKICPLTQLDRRLDRRAAIASLVKATSTTAIKNPTSIYNINRVWAKPSQKRRTIMRLVSTKSL